MSQLRLTLLGPQKIQLNGLAIELSRRKVMALLAHLAITRKPQRRDSIAGLLWPESGQKAARASLRRELHGLTQIIGTEWLVTTRETIEINPNANVWIDVEEFRRLVSTSQIQDGELVGERLEKLTGAAELYQGRFLAGFALSDSPEFDEWQFFEAEELSRTYSGLLETLVLHYESQCIFEQAISYARRWLALDLMREPVHRVLMRLFALMGQQAAAVRQYEECVRILDEELGVPPEEETTELFEAIRTRQFPNKPVPQPSSNAFISEAPSSGHPASPPHNLASQPTSFIGREEELTALSKLLTEQSGCRLLTLLGPGGIGKTRLAIETGRRLLGDYPNGVYFVPLVSVSDVSNIFSTVAEAIGFSLQGGDEPKLQLFNFLGSRKVLFIMDNFEHLLDGAMVLNELLNVAPNTSLLVTSREALGLQEEWLYPVSGMGLPDNVDLLSDVEAKASVQLFVDRARRADATFALTEETKPHLVRICQAVDGMPLGIELAASWLRALSCAEIGDEIERSMDLLSTTMRNVPQRHRSLRAIFDQTWQQLSNEERTALVALSIFRGGCTRDAANKVVGAPLPLIMQLVDKSLLQRTEQGRYQMHELFRQYAFEQLQKTPDREADLLRQHSDYFTTYLHAHQADLEGGKQRQILGMIVADIDNIRLAWQTAVADTNLAALQRAAESLCIFTDMHGSYLDGIAMFRHAVESLNQQMEPIGASSSSSDANANGSLPMLVAILQTMMGFLLARTAHWNEGIVLVEEGIAHLRADRRVDKATLARGLMRLCYVPRWQGNVVAELERLRKECISLAEAVHDRWCIASCLQIFGNALHWSGEIDKAIEHLQECLRLFKDLNDIYRVHRPYLNLGVIANDQGEYHESRTYFAEGIRLCKASNNIVDRAFILAMSVEPHVALGDIEAALAAGHEGYRIVKDLGLVQYQKDRGNMYGEALRANGQLDEAEEFQAIALQYAREIDQQNILADTLRRLSRIAWARQEYAKAEEYLTESIALSRKNDNRLWTAFSLRFLGLVLLDADSGREAEARVHLQEALQLALELQLAPVAMDSFLGMGVILAREEESKAALELLTFVEQHSASTYETKQKAHTNLATLNSERPEEKQEAIRLHVKMLTWHEVAQRLIEDVL